MKRALRILAAILIATALPALMPLTNSSAQAGVMDWQRPPDAVRAADELYIDKVTARKADFTRSLAEAGVSSDQYRLGLMYQNGEGVQRDYAAARRWLRKAAEQENAKAQYALGVMHHRGEGVPRDYAEAAGWYRLAAEQDYTPAQYALGAMHYQGECVARDYKAAEKWFSKAAEQGHAGAKKQLARLEGLRPAAEKPGDKTQSGGSSQAKAEAGKQAAQAQAQAQHKPRAAAAPPDADKDGLEKQYRRGLQYLKDKDADQGLRLLEQAAAGGHVEAAGLLGHLYAQGEQVKQDYARAIKWLTMAAEQGDAQAAAMLGFMYGLGKGVDQDDARAIKWLSVSAEQGDLKAAAVLAGLYYSGSLEVLDYAAAAKWAKMAAERGEPDAQALWGRMLYLGDGTPRDYAAAAKWLTKAAGKARGLAQIQLSLLYAEGLGAPRDMNRAIELLDEAAAQLKAPDEGREALAALRDQAAGKPGAGQGMWWAGVAVDRGDYAEAMRRLTPLAEAGNAEAQSLLGGYYYLGMGCPPNLEQARGWLTKAADQGDAGAGQVLEVLTALEKTAKDHPNLLTKGDSLDKQRARAERGDVFEQTSIALSAYFGLGAPQDTAEALKWFRRAAEKGQVNAQFFLGVIYEAGQAVPHDRGLAVKWLQKAAAQGNVPAQSVLAGITQGPLAPPGPRRPEGSFDYLKALMAALGGRGKADDAQIKTLAEAGDPFIWFALGLKYLDGDGVKQDDALAVKWLTKAAEAGHADAQIKLGWLYEHGRGVKRDQAEAERWYQKAAEQGRDARAESPSPGAGWTTGLGGLDSWKETRRWLTWVLSRYAGIEMSVAIMVLASMAVDLIFIMLPALLLRQVVFRRPIGKKPAGMLVVLQIFLNIAILNGLLDMSTSGFFIGMHYVSYLILRKGAASATGSGTDQGDKTGQPTVPPPLP